MRVRLRHYAEWTLLALIAISAALVCLGAVGAAIGDPPYFGYGVTIAGVGLVLMGASTVLTLPIRTLTRPSKEAHGSQEVLLLRYWGRLKSAGLLLNFLMLISGGAVLVGFVVRMGYLDRIVPLEAVLRVSSILLCALAINLTVAHLLSLFVTLERTRTTPVGAVVGTAFLGSGLMAGAAILLRFQDLSLVGFATLGTFDAPMLLLLGAVIAAAGLISGRSLPTLVVLFKGDQRYYRGRTYLSQSKSVVMPSVVAFALLFLVFLFLVLFGVGSASLRQPTHLLVILFIVVAMMTSAALSIRLARNEDFATLYRVKTDPHTRMSITILASSIGAAFLLFMAALMIRTGTLPILAPDRWVDMVAIAMLVGLGPYGFYIGYRHRHVRRLEERFPDLLRDIAASHRGGLTLSNSVAVAARGDYGALTPEVVQMANQLSWSVSFDDALGRLAQRVKTPLIERTCSLIIEASHSGGNTTDVLLAAAHDAREIKNLQVDRAGAMGLYTIIIYVTFFVFLTVAGLLYGSFVPVLIESSEAAQRASASGFGGLSLQTPSKDQYRDFYFIGAMVQGVGNGLVAGLMGSGRVLDGLRHSFIMVLVSLITFVAMV